MKNIITSLAVFFLAGLFMSASAQIWVTQDFDVEGMKVIFKPSPKNIISVRLFVRGGTANYPKEKEGIEQFTFSLAANGGTTTKDKIAFKSAIEGMGTTIGASTGFDSGNMSMTCIKTYWEKSWDLFVDAVRNPAFDQKEFDLMKEQMITAVKQNESNADSKLNEMAYQTVFEGMNYAKKSGGSLESLEAMTVEDLKKYHKEILGKKRCFLVVIGNIDPADLKAKVKKAFGDLPDGSLPATEERKEWNNPTLKIQDRDIATNYILGLMKSPAMNEEDGVPMMVAMNILKDRYWQELRTKRSLSYAPWAGYASGALTNPYSVLYISTTDPQQSIEVMVNELRALKDKGFTATELKDKKQQFLTNHYMGLETLSSQTNSYGNYEIRGDWRMAEEFTDMVNNVSLEDINRVIDKYSDYISWTYLGKKDMIKEEDFDQPINP